MDPVTSSTAASTTQNTAGTSSDKARNQLTGNFEDFLNLFITQLKYQDPLSPMDNSDFTNSLAALADVEQAVNTNSNLEKLIALTGKSQVDTSVSYLDKRVEFKSSDIELKNGMAEFSYALTENVNQVRVTVKDSAGNAVYAFNAPSNSGPHSIIWDGTTSSGGKAAAGVYEISVDAINASGVKDPLETHVFGTVDTVSLADGETVLHVGKLETSIDGIVAVQSSKVSL